MAIIVMYGDGYPPVIVWEWLRVIASGQGLQKDRNLGTPCPGGPP